MTGSNCCAPDWCHWFYLSDDGMHSKRFDLNFQLEDHFRTEGTAESRPYLLDWNRDGKDDLVMVLLNSRTYVNEEQKTKYEWGYHIFTNTNSATLAANADNKVDEGEKGLNGSDDKSETRSFGAPTTGADLKIKLDYFELEHDEFNDRIFQQKPVRVHICFSDLDGDGNIDLLYSESEVKHTLVPGEETGYHEFEKTSSAIFWKRNLTSTGHPRFAKAIKLYDAPDDWIIHSFSVADINQDGHPSVVANVYRGNTNETESELWLLNTRYESSVSN